MESNILDHIEIDYKNCENDSWHDFIRESVVIKTDKVLAQGFQVIGVLLNLDKLSILEIIMVYLKLGSRIPNLQFYFRESEYSGTMKEPPMNASN